jgi:hypothetical protein
VIHTITGTLCKLKQMHAQVILIHTLPVPKVASSRCRYSSDLLKRIQGQRHTQEISYVCGYNFLNDLCFHGSTSPKMTDLGGCPRLLSIMVISLLSRLHTMCVTAPTTVPYGKLALQHQALHTSDPYATLNSQSIRTQTNTRLGRIASRTL